MRKHRKIAILEPAGSHGEIIYSQILLLQKAKYETHLILRKNHPEKNKNYDFVQYMNSFSQDKNFFKRLLNIFRIRNYLKKKQIHKLIINTAQGAFVRDICFFLPRNIEVVGIMHNPQKLKHSFTQKLINKRIRKYFVLNDYILNNIQIPSGLKIQSFYPVFYPYSYEGPKNTDNHNLTITIPGNIDMKRRDYHSLLQERDLPDHVKIIFLGRCNNKNAEDYRKQVSEKFSSSKVVFFDEFIPENQFLHFIAQSDLILPLLTPNTEFFENYKRYKITGAINLSFGFKKPMLMHHSLGEIEDYRNTSFFYEDGELFSLIRKLEQERTLITSKMNEIEKIDKFKFYYQLKTYTTFIG